MRILLVSPRTPNTFWSFGYLLPLISKKAAFPPLGLVTVAAMLPRGWELRLVDLNVRRLADADLAWADAVFLSAMIVQEGSARDVVARAHGAGKPVVAGGPLFTTGHERFPEVDRCVIGEAEDVIGELVEDLEAGRARRVYRAAERPDPSRTPAPRWDLLRIDDYATMPVQFSRGCPFDCEFCDITAVYGRVPRVKTAGQVIGEFEALLAAGWKGHIFVVDDNFIGNRARVKDLLREIIAWRVRSGAHMTFTTEASLNLADDAELLDLMVRAGFKRVFIGIESPEEASLLECRKVQNTKRDLIESVRRLQHRGIEVMGGFIVGFDSDRPGIFEAQRRFIQESGIATAMVGLLTALPGTRLFTRLTAEGRMLGESSGDNLDTVMNFVPRLDRERLVEGYRELVKTLYAPREYYERILTFLREYRPAGPPIRMGGEDVRAFVRSLWVLGFRDAGRWRYWRFLTRSAVSHREAFGEAMMLAIMGYHYRRVAAGM